MVAQVYFGQQRTAIAGCHILAAFFAARVGEQDARMYDPLRICSAEYTNEASF